MNEKFKTALIWLLLGSVVGVLEMLISAFLMLAARDFGYFGGIYGELQFLFLDIFVCPIVGIVAGAVGGFIGGAIGINVKGVKAGNVGAIFGGFLFSLSIRLLEILPWLLS
jgi:hypothetical protein